MVLRAERIARRRALGPVPGRGAQAPSPGGFTVPKSRVLIVGAGSIGTRHARCFLRTERAEVAVCEPREERHRELAREYDLAALYRDLDEAPLKDLDCVVVCVPAHLHVSMALRALDAGCHVLIEKPLCLKVEEAETMAAAARATDLVTAVAYTYRSMPFMQDLREAVLRGDIGPVRCAVAVSGQHFPLYRPDYREIYYRSHETGGGALRDGLTHVLNYLQWVLGLETSVYSAAEHLVLPGVEVEDTVVVVCRYPGAGLATLSLNQFQWNNDALIELAGEKGTLRYRAAEQALSLYRDEQWHTTQYHSERDDYYVNQAHNFLDAVEGKAAVRCTVAEAAETVRSVAAACQSWEEGREVRVR